MSLCTIVDFCGCAFEAGSAVSFSGTGSPGSPLLIGTNLGEWIDTIPELEGVTVADGEYTYSSYRLRRTGPNEYDMDYNGVLVFGADTSVDGPVRMRIPGGLSADPFAVQHRYGVSYWSGSLSRKGWFSTQAEGDAFISLRASPSGHLGPTVPHVWAPGDNFRWDIRNLMVRA